MSIRKINIEVSTKIYNQYKDTNVPIVKHFKEFIDNSSQSYFDHKDELKSIPNFKKLQISIMFDSNSIVIKDNAFGMNYNDFERSVKLGEPKKNYAANSRSQYGLGMKMASMYLGDQVTIESKEYGSREKYITTLDSEELNKNIKEIDCRVEEALESEHYTKINISKLRHQLGDKDLQDLVINIGKIYHHDIDSDDMQITFNGNIPVTYTPPKNWIDEDTGAEIIEYFDGEFNFKEKDYKYNGWISVLAIGSVSDAGFSLLQYNRLIRNNYRPEKLFGKSNGFPYQRVIGEINLDYWPVVNNKLDFKWDDGLEQAFIENLLKNKKVVYIIKYAKELRTGKVKEKQKKFIRKAIQSTGESLQILSMTKTKIVLENPKIHENEVKAYISGLEIEDRIPVEFEGVKYYFDISYVQNDDYEKDWLIVEPKTPEKNEYVLVINDNFNVFSFIKNESQKYQLIQLLTAIIAIAQLSCINSGFKDSYKFTKKINDIIKVLGSKNARKIDS